MDKMFWIVGLVALYLTINVVIDLYDEDRVRGEKDHMHNSFQSYLHKETVAPSDEVIEDDEPTVSQGNFLKGTLGAVTPKNSNSDKELVKEDGGGSMTVEGVTGWYFPLDDTVAITDSYGSRSEFHSGLDLDWNTGKPINQNVFAVNDGVVKTVAYHNSWGYYAEITHRVNGSSYYSLYAHLKSMPKIKAGATIKAGDIIGQMGSTGNSSGQHLHLEIGIQDDAQRSKFKALESAQTVSLAQKANGGRGAWWYKNPVSWSRLDPRKFFSELDGKPVGAVMKRAEKKVATN